ncbi:MAG: hypothetical protein GTO46_08915 [Gemmatimonadetes bacterium]|nr:hypothetical protein [Gemmatimonadota bacterium]NIO31736.1 hypothetical protein [Gemmatimonadota bacterium]
MIGLLLAALLATGVPDPGDGYLYRTLLVRAAPGKLLELIDLYKERMSVYEAGGERPYWMRHTQGDQWDLLLLFPMGSFADYYAPEQIERRERAAETAGQSEAGFQSQLAARIAWREEVYVHGPALEVVDSAFSGAGYFHIEAFVALPGKREALLEERRMENAYLAGIGRPLNLIFTRVAGAAWDLYTIGFYRDIKHFAASADVPDQLAETSARAAGFDGADRIGTYMRTLIQWHRDTLATAVR